MAGAHDTFILGPIFAHGGRVIYVTEKRVLCPSYIAVHGLNLASNYSDRIITMKNGNIVAVGDPASVLTAENIESVYKVEAAVRAQSDIPFIIP